VNLQTEYVNLADKTLIDIKKYICPDRVVFKYHNFITSGMLKFESPGAILEIEIVEINKYARSIIYVSQEPAYVFIKRGEYNIFYKLLYRDIDYNYIVTIDHLKIKSKIFIFLKKILKLGLKPDRWISAINSLIHSRTRIVGLSLDNVKSPPLPLINKREILIGLELPNDICVSIIIPTKIRYDLLSDCIKSLKVIEGIQYEIIIIDNGAADQKMINVLLEARKDPKIRVIRHDIPFNFSSLCNLGATYAQHPLLLFLNDDIEALDSIWLSSMCTFIQRPDVGIVGARLLYPSRDIQHVGIATHLVPGPGHPWRHLKEEHWQNNPLVCTAGEVDAITGACLLIKKEIFEQVGGFDEERFPVTINDVDLCLKTRNLGLKVIYDPGATLLHKEGQTRPDDQNKDQIERHEKELKAFYELYPAYARESIFYPPNLRRDTEAALPI
jgi:GT2 family glycosyltransferase